LVAYLFRELPAISRLLNEDILFNRQYEIIYAFETFYNELWFGNGLKNYAYINENVISSYDQEIDFGAHNGYLSLLVQYGLVFSIIFYTIVTKNLYKISVVLRSKMREDTGNKYFYFIIIYTLTNGLFENSFSGINFFQGSLFWLVIGYVLYDINLQKSTDEDSILPN
jgi:O-antigen ligase